MYLLYFQKEVIGFLDVWYLSLVDLDGNPHKEIFFQCGPHRMRQSVYLVHQLYVFLVQCKTGMSWHFLVRESQKCPHRVFFWCYPYCYWCYPWNSAGGLGPAISKSPLLQILCKSRGPVHYDWGCPFWLTSKGISFAVVLIRTVQIFPKSEPPKNCLVSSLNWNWWFEMVSSKTRDFVIIILFHFLRGIL